MLPSLHKLPCWGKEMLQVIQKTYGLGCSEVEVTAYALVRSMLTSLEVWWVCIKPADSTNLILHYFLHATSEISIKGTA